MGAQNDKGRYSLPISEDAVRLAARLKASFTDSDKMILFTGAVEREGVSTVAAQVAIALAQMDLGPVLLLDANLHAPSLHASFKVEQIPGLSDLIEKKAILEEAIHSTQFSLLSILPVGSTTVNSLSLFSSAGCSLLMEALRERFRFVIIDSSPILKFVDTTLLTSRFDGVVIAIAAGERRQSEVFEVKRILDGLRANIIGIVLCEKTSRNSS